MLNQALELDDINVKFENLTMIITDISIVNNKDERIELSQAEFVASASFPPEVPPKPSAPVPVAKATLGGSGPKRPSDLRRSPPQY